jgi:hypothetical protein
MVRLHPIVRSDRHQGNNHMAEIESARVARAIARGRVLMATYGRDGAAYGLDTGEPVSAKQVAALQRELQPSDDGLFPGFTQTWRVTG